MIDNRCLEIEKDAALIANITRGALKLPQAAVVHAVLMMQLVLDKLRSERPASKFYACSKHKQVLVALTTSVIEYNEDLDTCENGRSPQVVRSYIVSATAKTFLYNLCITTS